MVLLSAKNIPFGYVEVSETLILSLGSFHSKLKDYRCNISAETFWTYKCKKRPAAFHSSLLNPYNEGKFQGYLEPLLPTTLAEISEEYEIDSIPLKRV